MQSRTCLPVRPDHAKNTQAGSREAAASEGMRSHHGQVLSQVGATVGTSPCLSSGDLQTKTPGALQGRAFLTPLSSPWAGFWSILHQNAFILCELQGRMGAVTQEDDPAPPPASCPSLCTEGELEWEELPQGRAWSMVTICEQQAPKAAGFSSPLQPELSLCSPRCPPG